MNIELREEIVANTILLMNNGQKDSDIPKCILHMLGIDSRNAEQVISGTIRMYKSLAKAVNEAGGSVWSSKELSKMSALDLISRLCTNNILFYFEEPISKKEV